MRRLLPCALLLLASSLSGARAASYVGASAMSTSAELSDAATSFDSDAFAWKAYAGHTLFRFFGLETTYRDLGGQEGKSGGGSVHADLTAFDLSLRGFLPLGKLRLFAKAGYAYVSSEGSFDIGGIVSTFDVTEWQRLYGAGIEWTFGTHFGLRAEWETYDVDRDLNSLSAGVVWQF